LALRWQRRVVLPAVLLPMLNPDEQVQLVTQLVDGQSLACSRFGLWLVNPDSAIRMNWELISKVRLQGNTLTVLTAEQITTTDDGVVVLQDLPPAVFELLGTGRLTDAVHTRVRRSVVASRYLGWPAGGGWVVLRRVPGRDGRTRQLRLDRGAQVDAPGFLSAVTQTARELEAELLVE